MRLNRQKKENLLSSPSREKEDSDGTDQTLRYLDTLVKKNPAFVEFSAELHQKGLIPAGTYVLDLDAHIHNAASIQAEAARHGIKLYYMSKQIGRNPIVTYAVVNTGFEGVVTVEPQEVRSLARYGIKIAHAGHLVNVPESEIDFVLKLVKPQVITVFNYEKAKMISDRLAKSGARQDLLIRPSGASDLTFPYMEGGVQEKEAVGLITKINTLPNVRVVGVTNFPCMLYDLAEKRPVLTPNFYTAVRIAEEARKGGIEIKQVNTPPLCITRSIELLAEKGSTHLEPGQGVSGMSPWQIYEPGIHPELPAVAYVSEVSHFVDDYAYTYGGGFGYVEIYEMYRGGKNYSPDPMKMKMRALVGSNRKDLKPVDAEHYHGILDYHARLYRTDGLQVGDTVVYGFRTQMFTTRAQVAVVSGLQRNDPKLVGLFDQANNLIDRHGHLLGEKETIELMARYSR